MHVTTFTVTCFSPPTTRTLQFNATRRVRDFISRLQLAVRFCGIITNNRKLSLARDDTSKDPLDCVMPQPSEAQAETSATHGYDEITFRHLNLKDNTLDENLPLYETFDAGRTFQEVQCRLGLLEDIPIEILNMILVNLDLRTLAKFRLVSQRASQAVNSLPQYRAIMTHAPNTLRGILSIGFGSWISCCALYKTLCTAECKTCGDFGGYIYILTCERVCCLCLSTSKAYLPLTDPLARRLFGVDQQLLKLLPHMTSIPGIYSPNRRTIRYKRRFVDPTSVLDARLRLHRSDEPPAYDHNGRLTLPSTDSPFDGHSGNPIRWMAVVNAPHISRGISASESEPEWGSYCVACKRCSTARPCHFRRRFTKATIAAHLRECHPALEGLLTRDPHDETSASQDSAVPQDWTYSSQKWTLYQYIHKRNQSKIKTEVISGSLWDCTSEAESRHQQKVDDGGTCPS